MLFVIMIISRLLQLQLVQQQRWHASPYSDDTFYALKDSVGSKDIIILHISSYLKYPVYDMDDSFDIEDIIFFHIVGSYLDDTVYDVDHSIGGDDIIFFHTGSNSAGLLRIGDNLKMMPWCPPLVKSLLSHLDYIVPEDLGGNLVTSSC